jgi:hypothetical protein
MLQHRLGVPKKVFFNVSRHRECVLSEDSLEGAVATIAVFHAISDKFF